MRVPVVVAHLVVVQAVGVALEHAARCRRSSRRPGRCTRAADSPGRGRCESSGRGSWPWLNEGVTIEITGGSSSLISLPVAPRELHLLRVVVAEPAETAGEEPVADPGLGAAREAEHPQPRAGAAGPSAAPLAGRRPPRSRSAAAASPAGETARPRAGTAPWRRA